MSSYANTVTDAVTKGEDLAQRTVSSITEIDNEVTAINEAITVIDQIAFQTNILSLNAAVEAATAGEAGKGFAVVAQEVRNLASRSAEAAKEIKEIVEKATSKASSGKNIAHQMIEGYGHLNTNIDKTIELIKEVELASQEQQGGIIQINDAVNSLDQQTQKNASVANEANDIAHMTQNIANEIVIDADKKEFVGKNTVRAKEQTHTSKKPVENSSPKKSTTKQSTTPKQQAKTNLQPIQSQQDSDDEWASF
jgi:methyl-accepting chemotaxis protein